MSHLLVYQANKILHDINMGSHSNIKTINAHAHKYSEAAVTDGHRDELELIRLLKAQRGS